MTPPLPNVDSNRDGDMHNMWVGRDASLSMEESETHGESAKDGVMGMVPSEDSKEYKELVRNPRNAWW